MSNTYNDILFNIIKQLNSLSNLEDVKNITIKDDDEKVIITLNKDGINTNKLSITNNAEEDENLLTITNNKGDKILTVNNNDMILHYNKPNLYYLNFDELNVFYAKCVINIGQTPGGNNPTYLTDKIISSNCYISGYQLINEKITYFQNIHTEFDPTFDTQTYDNMRLFIHSLIIDDKTYYFKYSIKKPDGTILSHSNLKLIGKWIMSEETDSDNPTNLLRCFDGSVRYCYKKDRNDGFIYNEEGKIISIDDSIANCYPFLFTLKGEGWSLPSTATNYYYKFILEDVLINHQINSDNFIIIR